VLLLSTLLSFFHSALHSVQSISSVHTGSGFLCAMLGYTYFANIHQLWFFLFVQVRAYTLELYCFGLVPCTLPSPFLNYSEHVSSQQTTNCSLISQHTCRLWLGVIRVQGGLVSLESWETGLRRASMVEFVQLPLCFFFVDFHSSTFPSLIP
jgi:hypothetical protein